MKLTERMHTLSEYFHNRHTPDILHCRSTHSLLCIEISRSKLTSFLPHKINILQTYTHYYACQTNSSKPSVKRKKDNEHKYFGSHHIHQIRYSMRDKGLYLFDILFHRFFYCSRRRSVQKT